MKHASLRRLAALLLGLVLLLSCAACGGGRSGDSGDPTQAPASLGRLTGFQGSVRAAGADGQDRELREDLPLGAGFALETQGDSWARAELNQGSLLLLDQNSSLTLGPRDPDPAQNQNQDQDQAQGQAARLTLTSGSLFFQTGEAALTVLDGSGDAGAVCRGCGWAEIQEGGALQISILSGLGACMAAGPGERQSSTDLGGGESACLAPGQEPAVTLGSFRESGVPGFVLQELKDDEDLCGRISQDSGMELLHWNPFAALIRELESIGYHGDAAACAMTEDQRAVFAQVLREEVARARESFTPFYDSYIISSELRCMAGLADLGTGVPALLFGSAVAIESQYGDDLWGTGNNAWGIWEYRDGRAVRVENLDRTAVYPDHLFVGGQAVADAGLDAQVYLFENGRIAAAPSTSAQETWSWDDAGGESVTRLIDGSPASEEELNAWMARWNPGDSLAGYSHGSDVSVRFWGLADAGDVLAVLEGSGAEAPSGQADPARTRFVTSYDPASRIRRVAPDTGGAPVEIYYEIPQFPEDGPGAQAVNAFFQSRLDGFFSQELEDLLQSAREMRDITDPLYCTWDARVLTDTEKLISVMMTGQSYLGGAHPFQEQRADTFRADTGERLTLSQAAEGDPEALRALLFSRLEELNAGEYGDLVDLSLFQGYELDDYSFYVENGRLLVYFNRYEGLPYFAGVLPDIELPAGLKAELR